jgi:hypothetical protein
MLYFLAEYNEVNVTSKVNWLLLPIEGIKSCQAPFNSIVIGSKQ